MAFVGLRVPHDAARLLESLEAPGERESASDMHVTMLYLGKGVPVEDVARAMVVAHAVTASRSPFPVSVSSIATFPASPDDGIPVICPVESPELHEYRAAMKAAFQAAGVPFSDKYPDYKPHITLGYHKPGPGEQDFRFSSALPGPLSFTAMELTIWGGDRGDGDLHIGIPFVLGPLERTAARLAAR